MYKNSSCSTFFSAFGVVSLFNISHSCGNRVISYCSFHLKFPDDLWYWTLFICLLATVHLPCEVPVQIFYPLKKVRLFAFLLLSCSSLYIPDRFYIYCKVYVLGILCQLNHSSTSISFFPGHPLLPSHMGSISRSICAQLSIWPKTQKTSYPGLFLCVAVSS